LLELALSKILIESKSTFNALLELKFELQSGRNSVRLGEQASHHYFHFRNIKELESALLLAFDPS